MRMPGRRLVVVHFDNYVHASGKLRVYTGCKKHSGQRRLYRYVQDFPNRERAVAFIAAWVLEGEECLPDPLQRWEHIQRTPTPAFTEYVYRKLRADLAAQTLEPTIVASGTACADTE